MNYDDAKPKLSSFHSRYAPKKEADRYLESALSGRQPSVIIIAGGGINYLALAAHERFPKACIVSLQPSSDFEGHEVYSPLISWSPSSEFSVDAVLEGAFSQNSLAGGVALVSWPPVMSHYTTMGTHIDMSIRDALESASSNAATTAFWAERWLHNSVRFLLAGTRFSSIVQGTSPIILACAGPSLIRSIPQIIKVRDNVALWALGSAVPALLSRGLIPDLLVSTDPGFWNGAHLRLAYEHGLPVAMPPSSYAPIQVLEDSNLIALDTGLSFERASLGAIGHNGVQAVASGSSAGTAMRLALAMTSGQVAIAGYDLAALGFSDHARPYAFDILDTMKEHRLYPSLAARASRVLDGFNGTQGSWRCSRAFSVYATSITIPPADSSRVARLGDSPVETSIPRACLNVSARGSRPSLVHEKNKQVLSVSDRRHALHMMMTSMAIEASKQVHEAILKATAIPFDAALLWKALAPRQSAPFLARAARAEASITEAKEVDASVRMAARAYEDLHD